jgi:ParB family transcriptional regulator, chromosome partitioning protein
VLRLLDTEAGYLGAVTRRNGDAYWGAAAFARLLALPDETVLWVLAMVLAETLAAGSALVEASVEPPPTPALKLGHFLNEKPDRSAHMRIVVGSHFASLNHFKPRQCQSRDGKAAHAP